MKILLALLFAVNMYGNVSPEYISTFYYDPSVIINFENWKEGDLSVKILSENGTLLYNDRLNTLNTKGIKYNLKNLTSGKYKVILENESKRVIETIILFDSKIVTKEAEVYFKPVFKMKENKLIINFLSFNDSATVAIYNQEDQIYLEKFNKVNPLNKVFNLDLLPMGNYKAIVNDEKISKTFKFKI